VSRKGIKRRDLNDSELREIIIDLLRLVRTDHILLNHEALVSAVRRGLVISIQVMLFI
jgi:BTB/POZ domain-containing protein 7